MNYSSPIFNPLVLLVAGMVAMVITYLNTQQDTIGWKLIKFVGIAASTIPLLGIVQKIVFRSRSAQYAQACAIQALAGATIYIVSTSMMK